jgi:hypothetical protein
VPDTDWLGTPTNVHKDADGNVIGESRDETDIFGQPQTVRYESESAYVPGRLNGVIDKTG